MRSIKVTVNSLLENKSKIPSEFNRVVKKYDVATFLSQGYQNDLQRSVKRLNLNGDEFVMDICCGTGKSTISCLNNL